MKLSYQKLILTLLILVFSINWIGFLSLCLANTQTYSSNPHGFSYVQLDHYSHLPKRIKVLNVGHGTGPMGATIIDDSLMTSCTPYPPNSSFLRQNTSGYLIRIDVLGSHYPSNMNHFIHPHIENGLKYPDSYLSMAKLYEKKHQKHSRFFKPGFEKDGKASPTYQTLLSSAKHPSQHESKVKIKNAFPDSDIDNRDAHESRSPMVFSGAFVAANPPMTTHTKTTTSVNSTNTGARSTQGGYIRGGYQFTQHQFQSRPLASGNYYTGRAYQRSAAHPVVQHSGFFHHPARTTTTAGVQNGVIRSRSVSTPRINWGAMIGETAVESSIASATSTAITMLALYMVDGMIRHHHANQLLAVAEREAAVFTGYFQPSAASTPNMKEEYSKVLVVDPDSQNGNKTHSDLKPILNIDYADGAYRMVYNLRCNGEMEAPVAILPMTAKAQNNIRRSLQSAELRELLRANARAAEDASRASAMATAAIDSPVSAQSAVQIAVSTNKATLRTLLALRASKKQISPADFREIAHTIADADQNTAWAACSNSRGCNICLFNKTIRVSAARSNFASLDDVIRATEEAIGNGRESILPSIRYARAASYSASLAANSAANAARHISN